MFFYLVYNKRAKIHFFYFVLVALCWLINKKVRKPEVSAPFRIFCSFPQLLLQADAGINGGDVPRCCGGLGANRIPAVFQNNWIEAILIDYYLGESARRSRRFRASGNKNITLAYLCIALSVRHTTSRLKMLKAISKPQTCTCCSNAKSRSPPNRIAVLGSK